MSDFTRLNAWTGSISDELAHFTRRGLTVCVEANGAHDDLYAVRGGGLDDDCLWSGGEVVATVAMDWDACSCGCNQGANASCDTVHLDGIERLWTAAQEAAL